MTAREVSDAMGAGAIVLDMRTPRPFAEEHLPGAVNLQFNRADLADRAEMLLPSGGRYIVHAEPEPIAKIAAKLLAESGFDIGGHLEGGLKAWKDAGLPTEALPVIGIDELEQHLADYQVVDVRMPFEYRHAHIPAALNLEWTEAWERTDELPAGKPLAVVCGDEVRSAAAASVFLRSARDCTLVIGGMVDWLDRGFPTEKEARPAAPRPQ